MRCPSDEFKFVLCNVASSMNLPTHRFGEKGSSDDVRITEIGVEWRTVERGEEGGRWWRGCCGGKGVRIGVHGDQSS